MTSHVTHLDYVYFCFKRHYSRRKNNAHNDIQVIDALVNTYLSIDIIRIHVCVNQTLNSPATIAYLQSTLFFIFRDLYICKSKKLVSREIKEEFGYPHLSVLHFL